MAPYEFIEHTADIAVRASARDINDLFAVVAEAMFDVITGGAEISSSKAVDIQVESIDLPGLLVGFLSELIVLHEGDQMVFGRFEVRMEEGFKVRGQVFGESFDSGKHDQGVAVKGISYHMLDISRADDGTVSAQVLFDI